MIKIRMRNEKWQIMIGEEVFQFNYLQDMEDNLHIILEIKNQYGRIKSFIAE